MNKLLFIYVRKFLLICDLKNKYSLNLFNEI